jgi:hypothetical protein
MSLDVRHDVVQQAVDVARVEQREDVRMRKFGGELDFAQEALRADGVRDIRPHHLDRDVPAMAEVERAVHDGHGTGAQLAVDAVPIGEARCELWNDIGHRNHDCLRRNAQTYRPVAVATRITPLLRVTARCPNMCASETTVAMPP